MTTKAEREARAKQQPVAATKLAAVDFDGTIKPWKGGMMTMNQPLPGAVEAVRKLKEAGYTVFIFTARLSSYWHAAEGWNHGEATEQQVQFISAYCRKYGIDADFITAEKVPAEVYLDDKALGVNPTETLLVRVSEFLGEGVEYAMPRLVSAGKQVYHRVSEWLGEERPDWEGKDRTRRQFMPLCRAHLEYGAYPLDAIEAIKSTTPPARYCKHCQRREAKVTAA